MKSGKRSKPIGIILTHIGGQDMLTINAPPFICMAAERFVIEDRRSTGPDAIEACRRLIDQVDQACHHGDADRAHGLAHDLAFAFEMLVVGHRAWLAGLREPVVRVGKDA